LHAASCAAVTAISKSPSSRGSFIIRLSSVAVELIDRPVYLSTNIMPDFAWRTALESWPMDRMLDATAAAEDRHFWFKGLRRQSRLFLDRGLAGQSPSLILDCGSGTGRYLDWLSALGPAVGIELSPSGLDVARRHGRRMVRGSVTALPFADQSAAVATSFDVLYMLPEAEERQAVEEMWRV
jgi:SAM-dependent methyltransferase